MKTIKLLTLVFCLFVLGANISSAESGSAGVTVNVAPAPVNCVGSWSSCVEGSQTYTITTNAANGGAACPYSNGATSSCGTACYWSAWSPASCPTACGTAASNQTRTAIGPYGGGASCSGPSTSYCAATSPCPISGSCSASHYSCNSGTSVSNAENATTWTWQCAGAYGGSTASCSQNIPSPTSISSSCASPGSAGSVSWVLPSGYSLSYFRVQDATTGAYLNSWIPENVGDAGPSTSFSTTPGHSYSAWVHTRLPSGSYSSPIYTYFTCALPPLPTVSVSASPQSIGYGSSSTISWTSTNATSCSSAGGGGTGTTGSFSTGALTTSTQYTVYCNNLAGTASSSVTVSVAGAPYGSITGNSTCSIASGASSCPVTLTWSTTNPIGTSAVTASGMTNVNGNSGSQAFIVPYNSRTFYLYNSGYLLDQITVSSSCVANNTWNGSVCTPNTYIVTPSVVGSNGTISPSTPQTVSYNTKKTFTVTPNAGYVASVGGTCGGTLAGNIYTTNNIVTNCTVVASFSPMSGTLTSNTASCTIALNGNACTTNPTLTWSTTNPVSTSAVTSAAMGSYPAVNVSGNNGSQSALFVVPYSGRTFYLYNNAILLAQTTVTSSCASGVWNGSICAQYTVTPSVVGSNGTISPNTPQTVNYNATKTFTVNPSAGYHASVAGTCGGSLVGNTYTTNPITANCTVVASFVVNTTGTISATGCVIPEGASSCNTTLNWQTFNPVSTSTVKTGSTTITTANTGTTTYGVPYNSRVFSLVNNGVTLATATATSSCANTTHWNGSICVVDAPSDLNTDFLANGQPGPTVTTYKGRSVTFSWNSPGSDSCVGIGFSTGTGSPNTGSTITSPSSTADYTLRCTNVSGSNNMTITVKVINLVIKEN